MPLMGFTPAEWLERLNAVAHRVHYYTNLLTNAEDDMVKAVYARRVNEYQQIFQQMGGE